MAVKDDMSTQQKLRVATIYPDNALEVDTDAWDSIDANQLNSIPELFVERVKRNKGQTAYIQFDTAKDSWVEYSWDEINQKVNHWRRAIAADGILPRQRATIRLPNSIQWVLFDQAVLAQGLVVVPVYVEDRGDNIAYILEHTESQLLVLENFEQWTEMLDELPSLTSLKRIVIVNDTDNQADNCADNRVISLANWLKSAMPVLPQSPAIEIDDLATIVYTSGTTGKPKGVMLSHSNMLQNAYSGLHSVGVFPSDRFLSFLPLSHMFERTVGYYLTMMSGAEVAFNRSIPQLLDDIADMRPTALITVPRIFERAYSKIITQLEEGSGIKKWLFERAVAVGWQRFEHSQGRSSWKFSQIFWPVLHALVAKKVVDRFGGRLRFVISGGARLPPNIAKVFIGLGIEILQGYGLTESSPVLTVNTLAKNKPSSIGLPLHGADLRLGDNAELQVKGPFVMLGYWKNSEASEDTLTDDGWLLTGDVAAISEEGYVSITGRIKEIIVLANGEKVPPADMESAICNDPLFEQAMVIGEGRAFLTGLIVLSPNTWPKAAKSLGVDPGDQATLKSDQVKKFVLDKIAEQLSEFPGYAFVRYVTLTTSVWNVDDGSITPTLKLKRPVLVKRYKNEIEDMYTRK